MDSEKAKNSINLSENEMKELLQLIFELGFQYDKISMYNLESYTKKFYNRFSYKKGLQLFYFLQTIMTLEPNKLYKPNELNKLNSVNFRILISNLLYNFGLINYDQFYSIKKDNNNLILPRELTELLQIFTDDLMILEKVEGIENIKEKSDTRPGRKKEKEIRSYEGYPSRYKLSTEYVIIKNLLNKEEFLLLFRKFIDKNQLIKNYLIFTLTTMFYNSSKLMNIKIKSEDKKRIENYFIKNGNANPENFSQIILLLLLFVKKEELTNLSRGIIDAILSSNDYSFILFLIKLSSLINKLNMKKSKLRVGA